MRSAVAESRAAQLVAAASRPCDLVVVGGGITGAGVALEAAARGLRVVLLEQADFAGGTSSRSTKLVHGGIRYLAQGHIGLVRESLRQRAELLRIAPHLVHPQPFVIPIYRELRRPLGLRVPGMLRPLTPLGVKAGLQLYDWLARAPSLRHRTLRITEARARVPELRIDGIQAAFLYHDARTDDVRLTHAVLATARRLGAVTVNYARVLNFIRTNGRIGGVQFEDRLSGRVHELPARRVVNAGGVWAERIAAMDGPPDFRITPGKGIHLVLRPGALSAKAALVIPETDDGRLAFLVPWIGDRVILGTTDEHYAGALESPAAQPREVAYLLDHANRYLTRPLGLGDVVGVFAGLRPLIGARDGSSASLSREHAVIVSPGGLVSIIGGKLTSFRQMARDVVDTVSLSATPAPGTDAFVLDGAAGLAEATAQLAVSGLREDQRRYLLSAYGDRVKAILEIGQVDPEMLAPLADGLPMCGAEIVYACREEMASSLSDVMVVRTRLSILGGGLQNDAADRVEAIMVRELGWNGAERRRQREQWERHRDQNRAALSQAGH